jgi:hypothetical protein
VPVAPEHAPKFVWDPANIVIEGDQGAKFDPNQERDDHGRWTDAGGGDTSTTVTPTTGDRVALPTTTAEVRSLYVKDFNAYQEQLLNHGGPTPDPRFTGDTTYNSMNVSAANPEGVTEEQRALCEEAAAKFLNDPAMQPLFDEYGTPGIAIASGMVTPDPTGLDAMRQDAVQPGDDPLASNVVAQWSNGTIFLYGDTAGNPDTPVTPEFSVAGADPFTSLQHEYGHQILGVIGYDANGNMSDFKESFVNALGDGIPLTDHMSPQQQQDFESNVSVETGQVSQYAGLSPDEAFAEFFATMAQEGNTFDVNNFDGGAAEAFRLIQDRITADTGKAFPS